MGAGTIYNGLLKVADDEDHSLGVVPADIEEPIALGAAHAGGPCFEASAVAAVGTDRIARSPRHRQAGGMRWPGHDGPRGGRGRHNLERRPRDRKSVV